jgi:hypothetical protein
LREASFNYEKIVSAHASALEAYIKKIIVACPTDKGDLGRQTVIANEGAGPGLFEWRTVCFSFFNLQSNFVSRFSPLTVIQI